MVLSQRCRSAPGVRVCRGFSLVELMVVIAVMAVLISLLLPVLAQSRLAAKGAVCLSGLRSMGQAVVMYCDDNHEHFPLSSHTAGSLVASDAWLTTLQDYGVSPNFRQCPLDPNYQAVSLTEWATSYATNEHFEPLAPGVDYDPITHAPIPGGRTFAYDRVGLLPLPCATIYIYEPEQSSTSDHLHTQDFTDAAVLRASVAVTRHLGAGQYLFADGHAKAWSWTDFGPRFSPATSPFDPATAR